jgi:hypothetical protein
MSEIYCQKVIFPTVTKRYDFGSISSVLNLPDICGVDIVDLAKRFFQRFLKAGGAPGVIVTDVRFAVSTLS